MKKILIYTICVLVLLLSAAGCSQKQPTDDGVEVVISPDDITADDSGDDSVNDNVEDTSTPSDEPEEPVTTTDDMVADSTGTDNMDDDVDMSGDDSEEDTQIGSGANLVDITCDEKQTLGYISCNKIDATKAELTIRNTGRVDLDGVYFKFFNDGDVQVDQYDNLFAFPIGDDKLLDIPLSNKQLWKVEVFPVEGNNFCGNKQLVIIPITNCR